MELDPHSQGSGDRIRVRTVFVSDSHLGCRYARADALLQFLRSVQPDYLYLVGDIIDGWRLKRAWYWSETYSELTREVLEMHERGTRVFYTPGNHDEFLRVFVRNLGQVQLADEFIHETADGRRLLIIHGDQFDAVVRHHRWLSAIGDVGYNFLLWVNRWFNVCRQRLGFGYWSLSAYIKHRVKQATSCISRFEEAVCKHAAALHCDGVVCGHIHTPVIHQRDSVTYYNTGDWVESCSALVEYFDGTIKLVRWPDVMSSEPDPHDFADASSDSSDNLALMPASPERRTYGADLLQPVR